MTVGGDNIAEMLFEESINKLTVLDFFLELGVSLLSSLAHDLLSQEVQLVLTRVNGAGLMSSLGHGHLGVLVELAHHQLFVGCFSDDALEVTNGLRQEAKVTESADGGLCGEIGDSCLLSLKGLEADIVGLCVLHPVDGEQVTEARADVLTIDVGFGTTVSAP